MKKLSKIIKHIKHPCAWAGLGVMLHSLDTIKMVGLSWASAGTIISGLLAMVLPNEADIGE